MTITESDKKAADKKADKKTIDDFLDGGIIIPDNKIPLEIAEHEEPKHGTLDAIEFGTVIDHIEPGKAQDMLHALKLKVQEPPFVPYYLGDYLGSARKGVKGILKVAKILDEKTLRMVAMMSGDATINFIRDYSVYEKFRILLCENNNCESLDLSKDAMPKFFLDKEGVLKCYHCRNPQKAESDWKKKYLVAFKADRLLGSAVQQIRENIKRLKKGYCLPKNISPNSLNMKITDEFTHSQKEYLEGVAQFAADVHRCLLESIFAYYADSLKVSEDLRRFSSRQMIKCGLEGIALERMINSALDFAENNIVEKANGKTNGKCNGNSNSYCLKPGKEPALMRLRRGAEQEKLSIINEYFSRFNPNNDYIISNALQAVLQSKLNY